MLNLSYSNFSPECGCDEAGRGCLAGPVVAAAVINPLFSKTDEKITDCYQSITDSKLMSEQMRQRLKPIIEEKATSFAISFIDVDCIDKINILNASILAMQNAIMSLKVIPIYILIDGNRFSSRNPLLSMKQIDVRSGLFNGIQYQTIIKGDSKFVSIAAASILAKTYRDDYMNSIHEEFPMYHWNKNKGYPTKEHREAIKKYGITKYHRKTFRLLPEDMLL